MRQVSLGGCTTSHLLMVIGSGNNNGNTDFDYLLTAQHANASSPVHFPNQTKCLYDSHINFAFILFGI